ncbi:MAG: ABC transporter substrate-binding protein [Pseudomonadota bacterium]
MIGRRTPRGPGYRTRTLRALALVSAVTFSLRAAAQVEPAALQQDLHDAARDAAAIAFYVDADFTHTAAVGRAIEQGLLSGFDIGRARYGIPRIDVIRRDSRTNLRRTQDTIALALSDPHAVALVGGMHTPAYLRLGSKINESQLPLLLSWSAGAALTRLADPDDNFIFRVSVDDATAAPFLSAKARALECARVGIVYLDNGWGVANATALKTSLHDSGIPTVLSVPVRDDARERTLGEIAERLDRAGADCVVFVLARKSGAYAALSLGALDRPPHVISHWGILGGDFHRRVPAELRDRLNLTVLQTCGLRGDPRRNEAVAQALKAARTHGVATETMSELPVPAAFAHGYDLALIASAGIAEALKDPRWSEGIAARRLAFRDALRRLDTPIDGILKTYEKPFSEAQPDGHEALRMKDLCLARFSDDAETGTLLDIPTPLPLADR